MNSVFKLDLPMCEKLTYIVLTKYADSNKRAWPGYETLAEDVSCSKRRVIDAVTNLVKCNLVVKQKRGNRSNVYLVCPPDYYRKPEDELEIDDDTPGEAPGKGGGEKPAPREGGRVQNLHAEGADISPSGCTACTVGVQNLHPISTSTSTKDHLSSSGVKNRQAEKERGPSNIKTKPGTGGAKKHAPDMNDASRIKILFKKKGFQVSDTIIYDYLSRYDAVEVEAAVMHTDFKLSRNPLAVISSNLAKGRYLIPVAEERRTELPPPEPPEPSLAEQKAIMALRKKAREGLLGKASLPVEPVKAPQATCSTHA